MTVLFHDRYWELPVPGGGIVEQRRKIFIIKGAAGARGRDTKEVLGALGYSAEEIVQMAEEGILYVAT